MTTDARTRAYNVAVVALYLGLAIVYTLLGITRFHIFRAGVDDGTFTQIIGTLFSGFSSTIEGGANHLLVHFSPILAVGYPFVLVSHGAQGLIVLQAFATAAVLFPVWSMSRKRMPEWAALAVTLAAALYPPLSGEAIGDFHELAFAPALSAFLVWAIDRRSWIPAYAFAAALACTKEDQFVGVFFVGLVLLLTSRSDRERRRCGGYLVFGGIASAILYFAIVRRLIDPAFPYWSLHFYQWWWNSPTPNGYVGLDSPMRAQYIIAALSPLAFLPLLSRRYIWFILPGFAEALLSHEAITLYIGTHYSATWSGYMLCAFADGVGVVWRKSTGLTKFSLAIAIAVALWTNRFYSPTIPGYFLARWPNSTDYTREDKLSEIPKSASIYSDDKVFAHLGTYRRAGLVLNAQDYLVFLLPDDNKAWNAASVTSLRTSGRYRIKYDDGAFVILKKAEI